VTGKRAYDDPCGLARALDLVGERWALLVVRELLFGPKRFSDLRRGLPQLSQNVLAQRLRELEEAGVLRRRRVEPPASVWAYELTERGRGLEPVLLALADWGSREPITSAKELSVDALMLALRTTFDRAAVPDYRMEVGLHFDSDRFRVEIADGDLHVARGAAADPDVTVIGSVTALREMLFGGRPLTDVVAAGDARVEGDQEAAGRFVALFPPPEPAQQEAEVAG
jgi:DNA-binding HxlR family transcriptional regulator